MVYNWYIIGKRYPYYLKAHKHCFTGLLSLVFIMNKKILIKFIYAVLSVTAVVLILISTKNDHSIRFTQEDLNSNELMTDFYTPGLLLHEGKYKVSIFYAADTDVRMDFYGNANENYIDTLPASMYGNNFENEYILTKDSQGSKLRFEIPEGSILYISDIVIKSDGLLYTDKILYAVIASGLFLFLYIIPAGRLYRCIEKKQLYAYIIMTAAVILAFIPHMSGRLYDGNDLGGHLIRIEGIKDGILDGQFPVVLFPRTLGEYGELGAMYPYLFLVFPALLRMMNISLLAVYNLTVLSVCIATAAVTYYCLRSMSISHITSALASSLYLISPAFIHAETDNGATLGTGIAYIFIPLVLVGLYHIMQGKTEHWVMLTIGFSGMLQSHLVTTLLMIPCSLFIVAVFTVRALLRRNIKKDTFLCILKAGAWCAFLNIWWIALFFYYYINADLYMGALGNSFSGFDRNFFFTFDTIQYSLLFMTASLIVMIFSRLYRRKTGMSEENDNLFFGSSLLILGCFLLLCCSDLFPWDYLRGLSMIRFFTDTMQFPNRFFVVISACTAILTGIAFDNMMSVIKKYRKCIHITVTILVFAVAILLEHSFVLKYLSDDNFFCSRMTGDISPFKQREYLPDGTGDDFYQGKHSPIVSDEENVKIDDYIKREDRVTFTYFLNNDTDDPYIELPMFFYPGYEARLSDGTGLRIETGLDNHMRVYLPLSGSGMEVSIGFRVMPVWSILTFLSICVFAVFIYINIVKKHNSRR